MNITNCTINSNYTGIKDTISLASTTIFVNNCIIDSNSLAGISRINSSQNDSIINCKIKYNTIGIDIIGSSFTVMMNYIENNIIGIKVNNFSMYDYNIYCNRICNNTNYDFYNNTNNNFNISNNYWCTLDSMIISTHIYDDYDNNNLGLVIFLPVDSTQCYILSGIKDNDFNYDSYSIFPNPTYNNLTVNFSKNYLYAEIKIYNLIGQLEFISKIENSNTELNISGLIKGIYIIELTKDDKIVRKKLIKQ